MRPRVSDHALLRYIERVEGIDVDALRRHLAAIAAPAARSGACYSLIDDIAFHLRYGAAGPTVVTVTLAGPAANSGETAPAVCSPCHD